LVYWDATSDQFVFIMSADGTATTTLQMGAVTPPSGEFFQISFGYDFDNNEMWGQYQNGARLTTAHAGGAYAASTAPFSLFWAAAFAVEFRMSPYDYDEVGIWNRYLDTDDVDALSTLFFDSFDGAADMAYSAIRDSIQIRSKMGEITPADLGLDDVDLEAAADATSNLIDGRDHFVFTIWSDVTDVAATVGDFSIFCDLYMRDGVTLLEAVELFNSQSASSTNQVKVQFGLGLTAGLSGTATIGTEIGELKLVQLFKLRVVKDTQADGASTLDVRMQVGD
jgi:hypothetical protein